VNNCSSTGYRTVLGKQFEQFSPTVRTVLIDKSNSFAINFEQFRLPDGTAFNQNGKHGNVVEQPRHQRRKTQKGKKDQTGQGRNKKGKKERKETEEGTTG
jgi:hypothetical protein